MLIEVIRAAAFTSKNNRLMKLPLSADGGLASAGQIG